MTTLVRSFQFLFVNLLNGTLTEPLASVDDLFQVDYYAKLNV